MEGGPRGLASKHPGPFTPNQRTYREFLNAREKKADNDGDDGTE